MYLGVDLGSTNMKAALYSRDMKLLCRQSLPVTYIRESGFVELDARQYFDTLLQLLSGIMQQAPSAEIKEIAFTGQAETLVVLGSDGEPLMNAISWMDERSAEECRSLSRQFSPEECEGVTGQLAILPTWPATKILWLKKNRPEIFAAADQYMLLKDYIVYRLTGVKAGDMSIATFSFYFDIYRKCYWQEMLSAIGITQAQLPPLQEPCTPVAAMLPAVAERIGIRGDARINTGTLDHFAGMIGTGNITAGGITLSTGTVMAMATVAEAKTGKSSGIAMHYGFTPDSYVMLPVAESGGVSLEWFHRSCMGDMDYDTMNRQLASRDRNELLFLPYLVGTNAPEFDAGATGVFWGLRQEHDAVDMAGAVMEGVSFVLRKNCDHLRARGICPTAILATGGGAKSPIWCQLQADITGVPVYIPEEKEAACLGAAMIAAVSSGAFESLEAAAKSCVRFTCQYIPEPSEFLERKYRRFTALYDAALKIGETE